jgi:uncharacterized protein DUF1761
MLILLIQINWLAVVAAGITALVIGVIWYLPPTFGTRWAGYVKWYTGLSDADLMPSNIPLTMDLWLLGFLVNAVVLAMLIQGLDVSNLEDGILLGVTVGIGFGLTISSWPVIHAKQPARLWLVNGAAYLVMQILMGIILTLWQ